MIRHDPPPDPSAAGDMDLQSLARDWVTLWQSELAAAAVDREAQETWQSMLALWAGAAGVLLGALPGGPGLRSVHERDRTGAADAARATTADAAPDARDAEVIRLARRVHELERRLADLERGGR